MRRTFLALFPLSLLFNACAPTPFPDTQTEIPLAFTSTVSPSLSAPTGTIGLAVTAIPIESSPKPVIQEKRLISVGSESFTASVVEDSNMGISMAIRPDVENKFYVMKDGAWTAFDIDRPMDTWSQAVKDQIASSENSTIAADKYFEKQIQYLLQADGEDVSLLSKNAEIGTSEWVSINDQKYDIFARWMEKNRIFESSAPNEWIAAVMSNKENYTVYLPDTGVYGYQAASKSQLEQFAQTTMQTSMHGYIINVPYRNTEGNVVGVLGALIVPLGENSSQGQLFDIKLDDNASKHIFWRNNYQETKAISSDLCKTVGNGGLIAWVNCLDGSIAPQTLGRKALNNNTLPREVVTEDELLVSLQTGQPVVIRVGFPEFWLQGIPLPDNFSFTPITQ